MQDRISRDQKQWAEEILSNYREKERQNKHQERKKALEQQNN